MARCSKQIVAINVGPGGQPEDVFEDILGALLERLAATQMPQDAPTGNLQLGIGQALSLFVLILLGGGGERLFLVFILWKSILLVASCLHFLLNLELRCGE